MQQIQSMCTGCQGQGERIDPKLRCKKCVGKKVNRERKILEVQIDKVYFFAHRRFGTFLSKVWFKGMEDGQKITFGGEGDQEPGLEPGDIIIVLDEKDHEVSVKKRSYQKLSSYKNILPINCFQ